MVRLGSGKQPTLAFGKPKEAWLQKNINPHIRGTRAAVMVWGCFCGVELGDLSIIRRNTDKRTGSITGQLILALYQQQLSEMCEDDSVSMQDNVSVHTAAVENERLQQQAFAVMEWPPYSPDLNPVGHLWAFMKGRLYIQHPNLLTVRKSRYQVEDDIIDSLVHT